MHYRHLKLSLLSFFPLSFLSACALLCSFMSEVTYQILLCFFFPITDQWWGQQKVRAILKIAPMFLLAYLGSAESPTGRDSWGECSRKVGVCWPPMCCSSGNRDELPGQAISSLWILVRAGVGVEMEGEWRLSREQCHPARWHDDMAFISFSISGVSQLTHPNSRGAAFPAVIVINLILIVFRVTKVGRLTFHVI